jgi:hypothetical protein
MHTQRIARLFSRPARLWRCLAPFSPLPFFPLSTPFAAYGTKPGFLSLFPAPSSAGVAGGMENPASLENALCPNNLFR